MKHFLRLFSLLLLCVVSLSCVDDESMEGQEFRTVGDVLPEFSVVTLSGVTVTTESLCERPCVLVFFHTGCGDCRIARQQDAASVSSYWEQEGFTLPVSPQEDRSIYNLFAERGIPRVYVCEKGGRISAKFTERVGKKKLRKAIEKVQ